MPGAGAKMPGPMPPPMPGMPKNEPYHPPGMPPLMGPPGKNKNIIFSNFNLYSLIYSHQQSQWYTFFFFPYQPLQVD